MTSGSGPKLTINKIYIMKKFLAFSAFLLAFSFQANAMDSATDNLLPEAEALKKPADNRIAQLLYGYRRIRRGMECCGHYGLARLPGNRALLIDILNSSAARRCFILSP